MARRMSWWGRRVVVLVALLCGLAPIRDTSVTAGPNGHEGDGPAGSRWTGVRGPLGFEDRVKAEREIERVHYAQRIWPKENPGPKPAFEQMIPLAALEAKVEDYLQKSAALGEFWQKSIEPADLQAEMDRMARDSRDPATLKAIFAALGDNPYVIAECLARPVLADRLIHDWYATDTRFHQDARGKAERALAEAAPENLQAWPDGQFRRVTFRLERQGEGGLKGPGALDEVSLDEDGFRGVVVHSPEPGRLTLGEEAGAFVVAQTVARSDKELVLESLVFAKRSFGAWWKEVAPALGTPEPSSGDASFKAPVLREATTPASTSDAGVWRDSILAHVAPSARKGHTAVWTGTEMIVWGGESGNPSGTNTGGRYTPSTDSWSPTSTGANVPWARYEHTAVWTGTEMIVWGGSVGGFYMSTGGGRYDPSTDSWSPTSTGANVPSARSGHTAVWTGTEMIVWGGANESTYYNTGGRYKPSTDSWLPTSTGTNVPSGRAGHTAVWTGAEVIVWGGHGGSSDLNSGGRYDPSTDSWLPTSTGGNVPSARSSHTAVWTGTEMIVWGGDNTGGRYSPSTDSWLPTSTGANVPSGRGYHTAVWTGTEMIVWGGENVSSALSTGGRYSPSTDSWLPTSTGVNVPSARSSHTAIWTGTEMIIWGGGYYVSGKNTGGRYEPSADSWFPTSTGGNVPSGRDFHTAIWTGTEMIVWGGTEIAVPGLFWAYQVNTGGRYDPSTDSWSPTSTADNVPSARAGHTAVWTGTEMVIWGGYDTSSRFNTGGRYNPSADSWLPTSTGASVPSARDFHTTVWTGAEMIVWGGRNGSSYFNTGGRYNPSTDSWTPASTADNVPSARSSHTAIWTGAGMIVWGGTNGSSYFNTGGRYSPSTDSWSPTSTGANVPGARSGHTGVWTGAEMIVWGGDNSGGRYNPSTDSWLPTSTGANVPEGRDFHTSIWAGTEMIVWGGENESSPNLNTGGRYNPSRDSWTATSTGAGVPSARYGHTAVWTGTEMIVWGGYDGTWLSSGGAYVPPVPTAGAQADYDGDGWADIGVFRNGMWFLTYSPDHAGVDLTKAFGSPVAGRDAPDIGDLNCAPAGGGGPDGKADLVILRKMYSTWQASLSPGFSGAPDLSIVFGTTAHKRIPTRWLDTNGDGCSDFGVFQNGCFDIVQSPSYSSVGTHVCFGLGTDQPLAADLEGDGRSDLILWRAASAHYAYRLSSENYATDHGANLGGGDYPILGDMNGDGRVDLGSYKAAYSTFRFSYSPSFAAVDLVKTFGVSGDVPILADVNGDVIADIGIFRNSVARWWFLGSPAWTTTAVSLSFGQSGDVPIYGKSLGMP